MCYQTSLLNSLSTRAQNKKTKILGDKSWASHIRIQVLYNYSKSIINSMIICSKYRRLYYPREDLYQLDPFDILNRFTKFLWILLNDVEIIKNLKFDLSSITRSEKKLQRIRTLLPIFKKELILDQNIQWVR